MGLPPNPGVVLPQRNRPDPPEGDAAPHRVHRLRSGLTLTDRDRPRSLAPRSYKNGCHHRPPGHPLAPLPGKPGGTPAAHRRLSSSCFASNPLQESTRTQQQRPERSPEPPPEQESRRRVAPAVDASGRAPAPPPRRPPRPRHGRPGSTKASAFSPARRGSPLHPPAARRGGGGGAAGLVPLGDAAPGIGGTYVGAEAAALLACVTATLIVLPLLLPPLPPPPPLFLLVPVAIFAVLLLLVLVPSDAKGGGVTVGPPPSSSAPYL